MRASSGATKADGCVRAGTGEVSESRDRLAVLDGWRGVSILLVLGAHLLPLSPKSWRFNEMAAPMGMALFFTLSGFLITRFLLTHDSIRDFLIRRICRIVPLAWLSLAIVFPLVGAPGPAYLPNFLFYANLPPYHLLDITAHFWSLGVEMQFYAGVALLVALLGSRGLLLLVVICLAVTVYRIASGAEIAIVTWYRVDEILAGAILALTYAGKLGSWPAKAVSRGNVYVLLALFAISCHPASGFLNYVRPYLAAMLVGTTLYRPPERVGRILRSRFLAYIAAISFALYVFHGILSNTWLGEGDKLAKYLKRPMLFAATFALAHLSTFYYEHRWIDFGKRLSARWRRPQVGGISD
jgi:peptidoglycan/LPS O-acetylase OafA/YrhL